MNDLPVILSYFAQSHNQAHLATLLTEQNAIQLAWETARRQAPNPMSIDYVARGSGMADRDRIIRDVRDYGSRLVLFHFSGHAGHDELLLNDGAGSPDGFAGLLEMYAPNLKLVILNGCSTQQQVDTLFRRGIRAVIATRCNVQDSHASEFAIVFHQTLCERKTLGEAYRTAILAIKSKKELSALLPKTIPEVPITRSMLNTSPNTDIIWGLFTQDNVETLVSEQNWWRLINPQTSVQPPIIIYEVSQYRELKSQLDEANNTFASLTMLVRQNPGEATLQKLLLNTGKMRAEIQEKIDRLIAEVRNLADEFSRIEPNTDRLRRAKQHFEAGEYEQARAIFDAERDLMTTELNDLLAQEKKLAEASSENQQKLSDKANEYLIMAQLTAIKVDDPNHIAQTRTYFDQSLKADRTHENLYAYAKFLHEQKEYSDAQPFYEESLIIRRRLAQTNDTYLPKVAQVLNNLAATYFSLEEYDRAKPLYEDALTVNRQLARNNPQTYLPTVAVTLNNLALLHTSQHAYAQALDLYDQALSIRMTLAQKQPGVYEGDVSRTLHNLADLHVRLDHFGQAESYYQEALSIRNRLALSNPQTYRPRVAQTMNNLAALYHDQAKLDQALSLYKKALTIRTLLAKTNPQIYQSDVAGTLNNLAALYVDQQAFGKALRHYKKALAIRRQLAKANPRAYQSKLAQSLNNLADFYVQTNQPDLAQPLFEQALSMFRYLARNNPKTYLPDVAQTATELCLLWSGNTPFTDKTQSLTYAKQALKAAQSFVNTLPETADDVARVLQVVKAWGEDPDAFLQRVNDSINAAQ